MLSPASAPPAERHETPDCFIQDAAAPSAVKFVATAPARAAHAPPPRAKRTRENAFMLSSCASVTFCLGGAELIVSRS
eukprot:SAG11_NODE_5757_length_1469_cov_4.777372_2_plen_78_part_00